MIFTYSEIQTTLVLVISYINFIYRIFYTLYLTFFYLDIPKSIPAVRVILKNRLFHCFPMLVGAINKLAPFLEDINTLHSQLIMAFYFAKFSRSQLAIDPKFSTSKKLEMFVVLLEEKTKRQKTNCNSLGNNFSHLSTH